MDGRIFGTTVRVQVTDIVKTDDDIGYTRPVSAAESRREKSDASPFVSAPLGVAPLVAPKGKP